MNTQHKLNARTACYLTKLFVCGMLVALASPVKAQSLRLQSNSAINLLDGPYLENSYVPFSSVRTSATSHNNANSSCTVNYQSEVKTFAESENLFWVNYALGAGSFKSKFTVSGNPNYLSIPLQFKARLEGKLYVDSMLGSVSSMGMATSGWSFLVPGSYKYGTTTFISQAGIPFTFGSQANNRKMWARVTPKIELETEVPLIEDDFEFLGLEFSFEAKADEYDWPLWAGLIADAISTFGLSRLGIAKGTKVSVGFDVEYVFSEELTMQANVTSSGTVVLSHSSQAKSSPTAHGKSDYSIKLVSVTVPANFTALNTDGLSLNFDSGLSIPITREGPENSSIIIVDSLETDLFIFDSTGVVINISENYDLNGGILSVTKYNSMPLNNTFSGSATSPDNSVITPDMLVSNCYWDLNNTNLTDFTSTLFLSLPQAFAGNDTDQVVIVKRNENSTPWIPVNTQRFGTTFIARNLANLSGCQIAIATNSATINIAQTQTQVEKLQRTELISIPTEFSLEQNYPNPFNPSTTIRFALPVASEVTLKVFDTLGREVATLVDNTLTAGSHSVVFSAQNLPSGIYFYRLSAGTFSKVKHLTLSK